ncbi:MAG: hypothetical protein AB1779_07900 [Candidatus Thermoplasmatota archaeon]
MFNKKIAIFIIGVILIISTVALASVISVRSPSKKNSFPLQTNNTLIEEYLTTENGNKGEIKSPWLNPFGYKEVGTKDHFDMPSNVSKLIVSVKWDDNTWEFEVKIGTGECPHKGQTMNESRSSTGIVTIECKAENGSLQEGQWFIHVEVMNDREHRGETISFTELVAVYR